jgi:hypothetical protein
VRIGLLPLPHDRCSDSRDSENCVFMTAAMSRIRKIGNPRPGLNEGRDKVATITSVEDRSRGFRKNTSAVIRATAPRSCLVARWSADVFFCLGQHGDPPEQPCRVSV